MKKTKSTSPNETLQPTATTTTDWRIRGCPRKTRRILGILRSVAADPKLQAKIAQIIAAAGARDFPAAAPSDSGRLQLAGTGQLGQRLHNSLCSTPFTPHIQRWPAPHQWELVARVFITRHCEHIREEIYRTRDLKSVLARAALFFVE